MVGSQGFPAQPVKEFVEQRVPGAKTLSARGAEFLFLLPLDAVDKFADFLGTWIGGVFMGMVYCAGSQRQWL